MQWRKKWADNWNEVQHCSSACRKRGLKPEDLALEETIVELLRQRSNGGTICPSEAARQIASVDKQWRMLMEPTRMAARRLVARGRLLITQKGKAIDPSTAKGPIRLRLTSS